MKLDDNIEKEIGKRFSELLEKQGYSVSVFAKKVGVSEDTIRKWKRGERAPSKRHLKKVLELLNVSSDYLLYGISNTSQQNEEELFPQFQQIMSLPFNHRFDKIVEIAKQQTGCPLTVFHDELRNQYLRGEKTEKEVYDELIKYMKAVKRAIDIVDRDAV